MDGQSVLQLKLESEEKEDKVYISSYEDTHIIRKDTVKKTTITEEESSVSFGNEIVSMFSESDDETRWYTESVVKMELLDSETLSKTSSHNVSECGTFVSVQNITSTKTKNHHGENGDKDFLTHNSENKEWTYLCDRCGKKYPYGHALQQHLLTHTDDRLFSCDLCGKHFIDISVLKQHQGIHSEYPSFTCDICEKQFTRSRSLRKHFMIHAGEKPFKCDMCGKRFSESGNLRRHQMIHASEKPFKCNICGKRFTQSGTLKQHHLIHTSEKPFTCDVCGKKFKSKGEIRRHNMIHTGEKRFSCDICGKRFSQNCRVKYHRLKHAPFLLMKKLMQQGKDATVDLNH